MEENQTPKQQGPEEKKALKQKRKEQKKLAKMKRRSRCRHLKNFLWWLTGVLTPAILLVIVIAVGTFLIPISTYFKWAGIENPDEYVSQEIANKNLFNGITGVTEYTMEDVPAVRLLINTLSDTLSEIEVNGNTVIKVDRQKLESLGNYKIIDDIPELFEDYVSCLSVVVTISDLGVDLGDIGQIPTINTFEEVKEDTDLTKRLTDGTPLAIPQLYYFDANQLSSSSGGATTFSTTQQTPDYRRAFKNDSNFVDELSTLNADQINALKYYYPALDHVPAVDFMAVFGPRFKMTTVVSLLNLFAPVEEDGLFNKILGGETIETIGSLDMTDIKLVDVLDPPSSELPGKDDPDYESKMEAYNKNREIYDILKDCTGKNSYEEISLSDLTNMNTNDIVLADFIDAPTSDTPCEKPAVGDPDYENKMEAYNAYHKNRKLYDILLDASDITFESCETYRTLKLKHLQNINIDHVKLVTVIEAPSTYKPTICEENYQEKLDAYNNNREIYSILLDATGKSAYEEITIHDLSSINVDNVILADILEAPTSDVKCEKPSEDDPDYDRKMQEYDAYHKNRKLYDILLNASGIEFEDCSSYRQITVASLKQINVDDIKLSTVLEAPSDYKPTLGEENYQEKLDAYNRNRDLYNLLMDATNKTDYNDITLSDLSHLNIDDVTLANIFEAPTSDTPVDKPDESDPDYAQKMEVYNAYHQNRKLYDILLDASGIEYEDCSSYRKLKVSHLSNFDINGVKLSKALEAPSEYKPKLGEENYQEKLDAYNKNRDLYNILLDSIEDDDVETYDDITIGHLAKINMDNVVLANIIDAPTSDIPCEEPDQNDPDYEEKKAEYDAYHKNRKLYDILLDASGIEYESYQSYRLLKVSHLNDFDMNKVKLVKVIEPPTDEMPERNRDIYNILLDCVTDPSVKGYEDITLNHLSNVEIDNVKLSTVMSGSSNDIIQTLIDEDNAHKDEDGYEPATLGNIGDRINKLLVKDVYEVDCFTTNISEAVDNPVTYYKSVGQDGKTIYSTTGEGEEYYVAKSSSVWLFMLFDAEDVDKTTFDEETGLELHVGTGVANKYVEMDVTIKELKTRINVVSKNIMKATVRQVCDSGMLEGDYPKIYGLTFSDAIKRLNDLHP